MKVASFAKTIRSKAQWSGDQVCTHNDLLVYNEGTHPRGTSGEGWAGARAPTLTPTDNTKPHCREDMNWEVFTQNNWTLVKQITFYTLFYISPFALPSPACTFQTLSFGQSLRLFQGQIGDQNQNKQNWVQVSLQTKFSVRPNCKAGCSFLVFGFKAVRNDCTSTNTITHRRRRTRHQIYRWHNIVYYCTNIGMHETHTHQTIPEGRDTDVAQPIDCALNYVERFHLYAVSPPNTFTKPKHSTWVTRQY